MVTLLNKNVVEMQKRRDERLDAAMLKLENIKDFVKMYRIEDKEEDMKSIMGIIKDSTKKIGGTDKEGGYLYYKYLDVPVEEKTSFVKTIIYMLFDIHSAIVLKEFNDFKKDATKHFKGYLDSYIDLDNTENLTFVISMIDKISDISLSEKNDAMDKTLFEIEKDLLACIDYNEKITKELQFDKIEVEV